MNNKRPNRISVAILAMGGQGGGVLCDWIVRAGERAGWIVQSTSVPGVAQRTGATVYYLELFPKIEAEKGGKAPVLALMPVPQDVDIVVAGELVEAGRAIVRGFITAGRTVVITSGHRDYAISEKMAMGDGRVSAQEIARIVEQRAKKMVCFDMNAVAEESGSAISAVLLGSIAGSAVLPVTRENFEDAIHSSGIAVEANLRGFASGFEQAAGGAAVRLPEQSEKKAPKVSEDTDASKFIAQVRKQFPQITWPTVTAAVQKLVDYQDLSYAEKYHERITKVLEIDSAREKEGTEYRLTEAVARHLALWMTYEDAIRVADLKIRSQRFKRVREEVRAHPEQIVRITEFMHPRVQEICDVLPAAVGRFILNNGIAGGFLGFICRKGRRITTNSVSGFLLLYGISGLRKWRPRSLRQEVENGAIETWLELINSLAMHDYEMAVEIARCQELVKGYGDTHSRGMSSFNRIMGHVEEIREHTEPARLVSALRKAALADEKGEHLEEALKKIERPYAQTMEQQTSG